MFIQEWNEPSCLFFTELWPVLISRPKEGRSLSWHRWLVTYLGGMPARKQSPISTDRQCGGQGSNSRPLTLKSDRPTPYRRLPSHGQRRQLALNLSKTACTAALSDASPRGHRKFLTTEKQWRKSRGGRGGHVPLENWTAGDSNALCPPPKFGF